MLQISRLLLLLPAVGAILDNPTFSFCPIDDLPVIACNCTQTIFPPLISSTCTGETPVVCTPVVDAVCGIPSLTTKLDFLKIFQLQFPLTAEICYKNVEIFGNPSPFGNQLCFEFVTPIFNLFTGLLFSSDSVDTKARKSSGTYSQCYASADGEPCEYCDVCADGLGGVGVVFQCAGEIQSSTCSTISTKSLPKSTKESTSVKSVVSLSIDGTQWDLCCWYLMEFLRENVTENDLAFSSSTLTRLFDPG